MQSFTHRGVIEGFYGTPWSHGDRLWMLERLGRWGMNEYVYAPKDDPLHLARWREPYPKESLAEFEELIASGADAGVSVGFAISPGRSIVYSSAEERALLLEKFRVFTAMGSRLIVLALDDVPSDLVHDADRKGFVSLAAAHVALVEEMRAALGGEISFFVVPTDYLGVEPTNYLETLGEELAPEVEIAWTGRTVVSPSIPTREAEQRARTLRRRVLLWDNVPVSDGPMRTMLHLGPYEGRDAQLSEHVSGAWLNPMQHAHASAVALATAARYLNDPRGYEPEAAWHSALEEAGQGDPEGFALFATAHRFSPLSPESRDAELEDGLEALRSVLEEGTGADALLAKLLEQVEARVELADRLRKDLADRELVHEIEPWLLSHRRESRRIQAALECAKKILDSAKQSDRVFAFFALQTRLGLEVETGHTSYGPRRVLYPQLVSMRDDGMSFGNEVALIRDRCLADDFVACVEQWALPIVSG